MSSTKISEQIRQALEESIRIGTLLPGDPIDEAEWSRRFDAACAPVRGAILPTSCEQHGEILAAIMASGPKAAVERMARHVSPGPDAKRLAGLIVRMPEELLN